jgi:hypothetical protein
MGVAAGDIDGDGRLDLAVTNFYGEGVSLYQNQGGGFFADRSRESGVGPASRYRLGFGTAFLDVDSDGWLDLITANGHLDDLGDTPYRMAMQFFHNERAGRFSDLTSVAGPAISQPRLARALAVGDVDNDGQLDLLVLDHNAPLVYLHNVTKHPGNWVGFQLSGTRSNRDAVGAVVTVRADESSFMRQRIGGGSYQSASDGRLHFGLGKAEVVEAVEVRWPSGHVDRFASLAANRMYRLRETDPVATPLPLLGRERVPRVKH